MGGPVDHTEEDWDKVNAVNVKHVSVNTRSLKWRHRARCHRHFPGLMGVSIFPSNDQSRHHPVDQTIAYQLP